MTENMDEENGDLYLNLDGLLKDMCRFLETHSLSLSSADRKEVDDLIERSKKYSQIVANIIAGNTDTLISEKTTNKNNVYNSPAIERYTDMSKPSGLPAEKACHEIKCGRLLQRKKVLNFIDVSTHVYATIHEDWLLLYRSSKGSKPAYTLDLKSYEAIEDESDTDLTQLRGEDSKRNSSKTALSFTVFDSVSPEKKTYRFIATNRKDMLEWVVNINRRHDIAVSSTKEIEDELNYETWEDIPESEADVIYAEITTPSLPIPKAPSISSDDRPAVPKKQSTFCKNIVTPHSSSTSAESLISYQDLEDKLFRREPSEFPLDTNETHIDEEDQFYYELNTIDRDTTVAVKKVQENKSDINFEMVAPYSNNFEISGQLSSNSKLPPLLPSSLEIFPKPFRNLEIPPKSAVAVVDNSEKSDFNKAVNISPCSTNKLPNIGETKTVQLNKTSITIQLNKSPSSEKSNLKLPILKDNEAADTIQENKLLKEKNSLGGTLSKSPILESKLLTSSMPKETKTENGSSHESLNNSPLLKQRNFVSTDNDYSKTPIDVLSSKPQQGSNILRIIRKRFSYIQNGSNNLETFSGNKKLETLQTNSIKVGSSTNLERSSGNSSHSLMPQSTFVPESSKNVENTNNKPLALLISAFEDENPSKKFKKYPEIPTKPKTLKN